jgi:hypothetical protein
LLQISTAIARTKASTDNWTNNYTNKDRETRDSRDSPSHLRRIAKHFFKSAVNYAFKSGPADYGVGTAIRSLICFFGLFKSVTRSSSTADGGLGNHWVYLQGHNDCGEVASHP